jgi:hypothetical protein
METGDSRPRILTGRELKKMIKAGEVDAHDAKEFKTTRKICISKQVLFAGSLLYFSNFLRRGGPSSGSQNFVNFMIFCGLNTVAYFPIWNQYFHCISRIQRKLIPREDF